MDVYRITRLSLYEASEAAEACLQAAARLEEMCARYPSFGLEENETAIEALKQAAHMLRVGPTTDQRTVISLDENDSVALRTALRAYLRNKLAPHTPRTEWHARAVLEQLEADAVTKVDQRAWRGRRLP